MVSLGIGTDITRTTVSAEATVPRRNAGNTAYVKRHLVI